VPGAAKIRNLVSKGEPALVSKGEPDLANLVSKGEPEPPDSLVSKGELLLDIYQSTLGERRADNAERAKRLRLRAKHDLLRTGAELPYSGLTWLIDNGLLDVELSEDKRAVKAAVSEYLWRSVNLKDQTALARLLGLKK
jgi:hypothetical protein